jgi:intermediate peptidase
MDFVEVPSILMEYFGKLPELLGKIGRHYKTSDPIPMELLLYRQSSQELLQGLEMQNQIQMAILDQEYHSSKALSADFDSSKIMYDLSSKVNLIPISHPMQYQVQFSHLFTYGSSYYSYLWCRKWASKIFNKYFMNKKVDEWNIGGHLLRHEILGTGGGRDPWVGLEKMGIINE